MKLNVTERSINDVLAREDVKASLEYDKSTPNRLVIRKELAKNLKAKEDFLVIKKIYNVFGNRKAYVHARLYKDEEAMKKSEAEKLLAKHKPKEEKKEEKAEAKAEPKPAEDKKEEPKLEAKTEAKAEESKAPEPKKEEVRAEEKK